jgi:NAD(P)-dependent dehydrogenase (short-subunit alcohol dehydrogenase family)
MQQLAGKRCLIVGGTGGLGQAAARRFLDEGAQVAVAGLPNSGVVERTKEFAVDATDAHQVERLFDDVRAALVGLDVLYHVAGASGRKAGDGALHDCSDDGWQVTIDTNLTSVFLTNRAAIRHFLAAKQPGAILNMASVLAVAPAPRYFDTAAYAAAKGGIIALSRYAAARYAADRIRVNVIAPGLIDTPMSARAVSDPAIAEFLRTKQPLAAGPGTPDDCASAAVMLCASEFITGVVLPIDGGWCVSDGQWAADD